MVLSLFSFLACPSLAQFAGGKYSNCFGRSHTLVALQFGNGHLTQRVQVVFTIIQNTLHQVYGTLVRRTRAYQYGKEFGVCEVGSADMFELFARSILFRPLIDR